MPRHNRRDDVPAPLAISPADLPMPPAPPRSWDQIKQDIENRRERHRDRTEARRIKRVTDAIAWDGTCCIPGCDGRVFGMAVEWHDPQRRLPICAQHEVTVWRTVQASRFEPDYIEVINTQVAHDAIRMEQDREAHKAEWLARNDGWIYFLRLNGLVKVGWTRSLCERLKAYGPDVEVLCHYRATRQDETLMHRQLRPYLAKGREWYEDSRLIADVVERLVEQHGRPYITAEWTQPKAETVKPKRWSA